MKPITTIAVIFLGLLALLQLLRFALAWPVTVNGISIPIWASAIAFLIAGSISVLLWREGRR
jgi:hypothetical protein